MPRIRTKTETVYTFAELSDEAKETAVSEYAERYEYFDGEAALDSVAKLAERFGARLSDYRLEWTPYGRGGFATFKGTDPEYSDLEVWEALEAAEFHFGAANLPSEFDGSEALDANAEAPAEWMEALNRRAISETLAELGEFCPVTFKGRGDCVLTGFHTDEIALDGFRETFYKYGSADLRELLTDAFEAVQRSVIDEYEYQTSVEAFSEASEANGWEYHEDGTIA